VVGEGGEVGVGEAGGDVVGDAEGFAACIVEEVQEAG
jgi:hypothetical protein